MKIKDNSVYWKTNSMSNAKDIVRALKDRYLVIQIVERKDFKSKSINQFDKGMQFMEVEAFQEQMKFIHNNPLQNIYQFYLIRTV